MENCSNPNSDGEGFTPDPHLSPDNNHKVQRLVVLSKKNGFVTVQNINEVIPDCATDPELIESIMNILDNLDIKLLDEDEVGAEYGVRPLLLGH